MEHQNNYSGFFGNTILANICFVIKAPRERRYTGNRQNTNTPDLHENGKQNGCCAGKLNCDNKGCEDVFNSYLVSRAYYEGSLEFPVIQPTDSVPDRLVAFSKAISSRDHDQGVHFFEYDYQFERVWRNPRRYLSILKRFKGVILPDFSLYRDMPLCMQTWNIYRSRAIGTWLQDNGVDVIVNMRFGDERTFPPLLRWRTARMRHRGRD